jgi:demethylmenaquinone methyltransferase/2-methoxy-6-polyprenyl-1,4-benzoquinol methylase
LLRQRVGSQGKIIGVDLTDRMLSQARWRAEDRGWTNVELVQSDAAAYRFPQGVDGVISSFITLVPEYDQVIEHGAEALRPGRRLVILDLKQPAGVPLWLVKLRRAVRKPLRREPGPRRAPALGVCSKPPQSRIVCGTLLRVCLYHHG